ncbi:MAG: ATP-binding protein [Myxococcales bacterium]|nr:ATP-binding protein [Myxococcales bacterium]
MTTPRSPFTQDPLAADDPRFVVRHPGVLEIERLFPSPVTADKGSVAIEGGVSIVGGPGMGKTSLLAQLAAKLDRDRQLTTATVTFPQLRDYASEEGFYPFVGQLVTRIRDALLASPRLHDPLLAPVAGALQAAPSWDGPAPETMTPRGFERFIGPLAQAAQRTPGVCLLFDDVDPVTTAPWRGPFISALRFVFQASTGITPIYALWTLFGDESLPGSNYFRNVTRPVFLEPLAEDQEGARQALIASLDVQREDTRRALAHLWGGHPLLLQQGLSALDEALVTPESRANLTPEGIDAALGPARVDAQLALVRSLLDRSMGLPAALRELAQSPVPFNKLPRGLVASGFVDRTDDGLSCLPPRVGAAL